MDTLPYLIVVVSLCTVVTAVSRDACCRSRGVSDKCARALCDPARPPDDFHRYSLFEHHNNCSRYLNDISICLSDGRDHTECCKTEAKDSDERACFGMCSAAVSSTVSWPQMQTCIALNIGSIYSCYVKGYRTSPGPPHNLRVDSDVLRWDAPDQNAHLVEVYTVFITTDTHAKRPLEIVKETQSTRLDLSSMRLGNRYSIYIVAEGTAGKSLGSEVFAIGGTDSDTLLPLVLSPMGGDHTTLGCTIRTRHHNVHIDWERKSGSTWRRVEGNRFRTVSYPAEDDSVHLGSLHIRQPGERDEGVYRCVVRGHPSEFREVRLQTVSSSAPSPSPALSPPETPFECCSKKMTRPNCSSMCTAGSDRKRGVKPGAFLPQFRCEDEFHNLLQCTLTEVQYGACCIRKKVPYHCLGLCDKSISIGSGYTAMTCLQYLDEVYSCHEEAFEVLPYAVSGVTLNTIGEWTTVEWRVAEGATGYTVYYRKKGVSSWRHSTTNKTVVKVRGAEEVAILATNSLGHSSAVRMALEEGEWGTNYE